MLNLIKRNLQNPVDLMNAQTTGFDGLYHIRQWLNKFEINNPAVAHFICRMVPVQCPFERDICLFGRTLLHIPPLCKLNPLSILLG